MICPNCFAKLNSPGKNCDHCGYLLDFDQEAHLLPSGTILHDTYIIGKVLGEGGFGITYLAYNKNIQMKVAIKEFFPKGLTSRDTIHRNIISFSGNTEQFEAAKQQFINEARMLAKFQYLSGIASVYDCFEENGTAYIVMEYIEGYTLKEILRTYPGKLEVEICLTVMRPVMDALNELHKNGIIHRDISPDNLIMRQDGSLVLIDFGAARDFVINQGYDMSIILRRRYAPIEQYSYKNIQGPWTDVYALCATIYRSISGTTLPEATNRIVKDEIQKPSELGIEIDPAVEAALMKGLAILGENRYQSITELKEGLYGLKEVEPQEEKQTIAPTTEELIVEEDDRTEGVTFAREKMKQTSVAESKSSMDISKPTEKKSGKKYFAVAGLLLVILVGVIVFMSSPQHKLDSLVKKAEQGDVEAMVNVGDMYFDGDKIEQDYTSALEWYQKAAEMGNTDVLPLIGDMYSEGNGVEQDYKEAKNWYKKGVALGDPLSIYKNGEMYEYGRGVKKDQSLAESWYQLSEDIDSNVGMFNLGDMYYFGKGIPKDRDKAMEWYQKAADAGNLGAQNRIKAENGDKEAMVLVGDAYRDGGVVKQDLDKAIKWYQKAAEKKNAEAMSRIGSLYYYGKGVKKDYKKAKQWYEKGVALGDSASALKIGDIYENGYGVKKNEKYAEDWRYIGGIITSGDGMNNLGYMYENGYGVKQDYKKAVEWYEKAAEKGDDNGMTNLAWMYTDGYGVKKDYEKAVEWNEKAIKKGNARAMTNLGYMYENGYGVKKDYKKAVEWYKKAAEKGDELAKENLKILGE